MITLLVGCGFDFTIASNTKDPALDTGISTDSGLGDTTETTPTEGDTTETAGTDLTFDTEDSADPTEADDTGPTADSAPVDDPPPADDCDTTSDLIYALSRDDGQLYTFDPASETFSTLGRVDCGTSQSPASMAVDRTGTAYVRYSDDSVYALDLATMRCQSTGYSDRRTGFGSFGMGYATDSAGTWRDQLYVANGDTLGVLDTSSWTLRELGRMPSQSELTGNADGELWALLPLERVAELRRLDTTSGATLETLRLPDFPDPSSIDTFAFATWNGAFYLFVRSYGMGESTDVFRVSRSGDMTRVLDDVGFDVVGAGVSTCAPA